MNILVLSPLVPYPPHDGDKLRLFHLLKYLKGRGHRIDLFCLTRVRGDLAREDALRGICRKVHVERLPDRELFFNLIGGVLLGQSMNVSSYFSPALREGLKAYWTGGEGRDIDVVLSHRLRMAPAAFSGSGGRPVVLELTDCLAAYTDLLKRQSGAPWSRRLAAWWDHWFLKREEVEWTGRSAKTILISGPDAQALKDLGAPEERITVIPNGVEAGGRTRPPRPEGYPPDRPVVCFVGNMGYAPNEQGALWFLGEVWPKVKERAPEAFLALVGGAPRKLLRRFHDGKDILVTGWVREVEPYLRHAALSVAPLRVAAGMQNKVALSLSLGVPVVATSAAVSWMEPKGRGWVRQADGEQRFAEQVADVLKNPGRAQVQARRGRDHVLRQYRWSRSGAMLEKVLKDAIK